METDALKIQLTDEQFDKFREDQRNSTIAKQIEEGTRAADLTFIGDRLGYSRETLLIALKDANCQPLPGSKRRPRYHFPTVLQQLNRGY